MCAHHLQSKLSRRRCCRNIHTRCEAHDKSVTTVNLVLQVKVIAIGAYLLNLVAGDSDVVCIDGQCHMKSRSSRHSAPTADYYDVDRGNHHHRRTQSRSWSLDDDEAWPSDGSNVNHSYSSSSSSARLIPSFDDDDNWTVLSDLGHRGVDQYPDGNPMEESRSAVRFSDGSYDEKSRRYGWRFDIPGDPYCLKYEHDYYFLGV